MVVILDFSYVSFSQSLVNGVPSSGNFWLICYVFHKQCDEYHKRYLILRNCREAPSFFNTVYNNAATFLNHLRRTLAESNQLSKQMQACNELRKCEENHILSQKSKEVLRTPAAPENVDSPEHSSNKYSPAGSGSKSIKEETAITVKSNSFSNSITQKLKSYESDFPLQREAILEKQFFSSMTSVTQ